MDLHSIISNHPHLLQHIYIHVYIVLLLQPFMPCSHGDLSHIFLPLSLPEAVLIKALNIKESIQEDWWRNVVTTGLLSWGGMFIQPDSMTQLILLGPDVEQVLHVAEGREARTSGTEAVPLRSVQMMGEQQQKVRLPASVCKVLALDYVE